MTYLASPYSHPDSAVREKRFHDVCKVAAQLMRDGQRIFSPIAHTHPIAECGGLPGGWDFWEPYDREMLAACTWLMVLEMTGWTESRGVQAEIRIAKELEIPIEYVALPQRRCPNCIEGVLMEGEVSCPRCGSVPHIETHYGWVAAGAAIARAMLGD